MEFCKEHHESFIKAAEPLMKWLAENMHPHSKIIVEADSAELVEGLIRHVNPAFIKD